MSRADRHSRQRYRVMAPVYDVVSLEWPLYRAGRVAGIRAARLRPGHQVLDVGCGTGLSLPLLSDAVGPRGRVIGLDPSTAMLRRAARREVTAGASLLPVDAAGLRAEDLSGAGVHEPVHAAVFAYSLSVMPDWRPAWAAVTGLLAPGARVVVVDLAPPTRGGLPARLTASALAALGGSDLHARPWQALIDTCDDIEHASFRGGHVQVWAGTLPLPRGQSAATVPIIP
ncbi:class I SAM-dependent methyltransferase [Janibacter sp. GS2]|uniref:class I SAM-dependent methyltransferase n=1 Tax=Janibacter sp. GS2 TaxID=3442646 RepID=UPI003EBBE5EB